jgi:hypothetical protein
VRLFRVSRWLLEAQKQHIPLGTLLSIKITMRTRAAAVALDKSSVLSPADRLPVIRRVSCTHIPPRKKQPITEIFFTMGI